MGCYGMVQAPRASLLLGELEARAYVLALGRKPRTGSQWNRRVSRKRRRERAAIVRFNRFPVLALHLAAMEIQRMVRGHQVRLLVAFATSNEPSLRHRAPRASRRAAIAAAAMKRRPRKPAAQTPAPAPARASTSTADLGEEGRLEDSEIGLISRFLEARMRSGEGAAELTFNDWVLTRLQAWGRMLPWRTYLRILKRQLLRLAAGSIQRGWRTFLSRGPRKGRSMHSSPASRAAFSIQRAWRSFTYRQIYSYYRDTIKFREEGEAHQVSAAADSSLSLPLSLCPPPLPSAAP